MAIYETKMLATLSVSKYHANRELFETIDHLGPNTSFLAG